MTEKEKEEIASILAKAKDWKQEAIQSDKKRMKKHSLKRKIDNTTIIIFFSYLDSIPVKSVFLDRIF